MLSLNKTSIRGTAIALGLITLAGMLPTDAWALDSTLVRAKLSLSSNAAGNVNTTYTFRQTTRNIAGTNITTSNFITYTFPASTDVSGATGTFKTTGQPVGIDLVAGVDGQGRPTLTFQCPTPVASKKSFTVVFSGITNATVSGAKVALVSAQNATYNPATNTGHDTGLLAFTILPGSASKLGFVQQPASPSNQNRTIVPPVVVAVQDAFGNTITGSTVTISMAITAGTGAPGAVLSGTLSNAAAGGIATFSDLSLNLPSPTNPANPYRLRATATGGITLADSNPFEVVPGPPYYLVFNVQPPTSAVAGNNLMMQVTVKDGVTNATVTNPAFTISLFTSPAALLFPANAASVEAGTVNGVATFNVNVHLAGTYNFVATASDCSGASSNAVAINPGPASALTFVAQPADTVAGFDDGTIPPPAVSPILSALGEPVEIAVTDSFGNIVTGRTDTITVSINFGTAGASLTGNLAAVAGSPGSQDTPPYTTIDSVALFDNLNINLAGGYTLRAQAAGLSDGISSSFKITPDAASYLVVSNIANPSVLGVATSMTVTAKDQFGNTDSNYLGTVTFTTNDSATTVPPDEPFIVSDIGEHNFPGGVVFNAVGLAQSVTATDTQLSSITGTQSVIVSQGASSTTVLSAFPNPSAAGQPATFTAQVSGAGVTPTGTVTFKDGASTLGSVTLDANGVAVFSTNTLTLGTHSTITANYSGDTNYLDSSSGNFTQQVVANSSTTTLAIDINPSVSGQPVTFTATVVSSPSGTPTGSVQFRDGTTVLGSSSVSGGQAVFTTSLSAGTHNIYAVYNGDGSVAMSASNTVAQTVNPADTATTVNSSSNPSVFGQNVTFIATVNPVAPGGGTPTGTVIFTIDGIAQGPLTLSGTTAYFNTSALSVGNHTIDAAYNGDANFNSSSGSIIPAQTVNPAGSTVAVASSADPSVFGQALTFTAMVAALAPGSGSPTGTVVFTIDTVAQNPVTLNGGSASLGGVLLDVGNHTVSAAYSGDVSFNASSANLIGGQDVTKADSAVALASSVNPSLFGQSVTFTATLSPGAPGAGTPAGSVTFSVDGSALTPVAISGGAAALSLSNLAAGAHTVGAAYSGDANFLASSGSLVGGQQVNAAASTTTLSASANPADFSQPVSITATAAAVAPGGGTPGGNVVFTIDGNAAAPVVLSGGQAVLTTSTLSIGSHLITAAYGGSSSFTGSTSAQFLLNVIQTPAKLAFVNSPADTQINAAITPAVQVAIQDAFGNNVSAANATITLEIGANPSAAALSGTASLAAANGIATFSGLKLNALGAGYTFAASASGLTGAASSAFNIVDKITPVVVSGPAASAAYGIVNVPVDFTFFASDDTPVTYTWNFGDGSTAATTATTVTHTFSAPASYPVSVTAADQGGQSVSGALNFEVIAPVVEPTDLCGPNPAAYSVKQVQARLRFPSTLGKDSLIVKGTVQLPAGFNPLGQVVQWEIGGIGGLVTLDAKGASPRGNLMAGIKYKKPRKGTAFTARPGTLSISMKNQNLGALALAGVPVLNTNSLQRKGDPATLETCVLLKNVQGYHATSAGLYKSKKDKTAQFGARFK